MSQRIDFVYSEKQEPHRLRTRQILQQHPEVRKLIGKNKYTFFAVLGLVLFQVAMSWLLKDSSWWIVVGSAYPPRRFRKPPAIRNDPRVRASPPVQEPRGQPSFRYPGQPSPAIP